MPQYKNPSIDATVNEVIRDFTVEFCKELPRNSSVKDLQSYEKQILTELNSQLRLVNLTREKEQQIRLPKSLSPMQVATIINATLYVCRVPAAGQELDAASDLLMLYQADPDDPNFGMHIQAEDALKPYIRALNYAADKRFHAQVLDDLLEIAPRKMRCKNRDLVAVNNGIFIIKRKNCNNLIRILSF